MPRPLRTISFRLAALYAGIFVASIGLLFAIVYWIAAGVLQEQTRAILQNEMTALIDAHDPARTTDIAAEIGIRLKEGRYRPIYYRLETGAGETLAGNLPALRLPPGWHKFSYPVGALTSYPPEDEDEHTIRLLGLTYRLSSGPFLTVAIDTYRTREAKEAIIRAFAWAASAGLVLALLGGFLLSRGFLRRVDEINTTTRAIVDGNLDRRIETTGSGDEIDRLSLNLNEMLDRLHFLMEGLRQVSNDIAHDLRTPLSRLKQRLEDVQESGSSVADFRLGIDLALQDTNEALATFGALLRIAQIEAGTRRSQFADINLSGLLDDLAMTYGPVAEDIGKTLNSAVAPAVSVSGDRELLVQMFVNLIENAIRHTTNRASITLTLRQAPGGPVAEIADNGPGIPAGERDKVFQRFYRLETSRTTPGSGLGMSLVAAVAALHGVKITLGDNKPGLIVRLVFPLRG